jgi:MFS family permease
MASALPVACVFSTSGGDARPAIHVVLLAASSILLGGLTIPFILARLPVLAGARSGEEPRVAVAQGLVTQLGAGGALLGPPFAGFIVETYDWTSLGLSLAAMTVVVAILFVGAELCLRRPAENCRMQGRQSLPH